LAGIVAALIPVVLITRDALLWAKGGLRNITSGVVGIGIKRFESKIVRVD